MGTRADYYIGVGERAEWIGSSALDGYPTGLTAELVGATDERAFRAEVEKRLARRDGTATDMGWPWPWETSRNTDYAYCFADGRVHVFWFGRPVDMSKGGDGETCEDAPKATFPDMTARKNVTLGPRSGLIVLGI